MRHVLSSKKNLYIILFLHYFSSTAASHARLLKKIKNRNRPLFSVTTTRKTEKHLKKKIAVAYLRAKDGGKLQDGAGPYW